MSVIRIFLGLAAGIAFASSLGAAQAAPADWSAWGGVTQWEGTATIRTWSLRERAAHGTDERHETEQSIKLRFTLEREARSTESWRATRVQAEMTGASNYAQFQADGGFQQWTETIDYVGALRDIQEMVLVLPPGSGRWEVLTPGRTERPYVRGAQGVRRHGFPLVDEPIAESYADDAVPNHAFGGQAPRTVGPLEASGVLDLGQRIENGQYPALKEFRILLRPVFDDYRLIVTIDDYAKWRPLGSIAQPGRPGSALAVKATVHGQAGGPPPAVKAIRFRLLDVSREPGVCLNWPLGATDRNPDLKLAATPECPGAVSQEDQQLEVTSPLTDAQQRPYALARVDSYDFGARASLYVTCELTNGTVLVGELPGAGGDAAQDLIRLPRMSGPGWIAGVWKQENNVAALPDTDDREKVAGQQYDGDGYTLYEEYRGWVVDGNRVEGDPQRKDFFVLNLIGADARKGIELFEKVSQLRVHSKLKRTEMSEKTRLMNGNRRDAPQRVKQHGVWVKTFDSVAKLGGTGAFTPMTKEGVSGRPGITVGIGLLARTNPESTFNQPHNLPRFFSVLAFDRAIAHELLHSVGVEHHGPGPYWAYLGLMSPQNPLNQTGRPYFKDIGGIDAPQTLLYENGHDVAADFMQKWAPTREFLKKLMWDFWLAQGREMLAARKGIKQRFDTPEKWAEFKLESQVTLTLTLSGSLGMPQGDHSGQEDCLTRYYFAKFYPVKGRKHAYYLVTPGTEPFGLGLCRATTGTGVNAASRQPQSRYGDAGKNGGNCFSQICPNDAIPPKKLP